MRRVIPFLITILVTITSGAVKAQADKEDVILKALQDELDRNMNELKMEDSDGPFFMMYGIVDQKSYSVAAMLGSIIRSDERPVRYKNTTRILVGGYEFNDESLQENAFSAPSPWTIALPMDDDYDGIRRSFWSTTDKVYRDAARHYKKNKETLEATGKKLDEITHRSFAKGAPINKIESLAAYDFDKKEWEDKVRRLSSLFLDHPDITNSAVMLLYNEGYKYLVNSEGVKIRIPFRHTNFVAVGQKKSEDGEITFDQVIYAKHSPEELPSEEELKKQIESMIQGIETQTSIPKLNEEYTGPVLLIGEPVADYFSGVLLRSGESIMANDNIPRLEGYQYDQDMMSMDGKVGKQVMNEFITIKARPTLKKFGDVDLLGSYEVDSEGMVPVDDVVVVERGVLKCLLNNRTLTHKSQVANGFADGPGVLEVMVSQKVSVKELKQKLMAEAKKQGLEFALILRQSPSIGLNASDVYKVYVEDGREERVRHGMLSPANFRDLRHIIGASGDYEAYNSGYMGYYNVGGMPGGREMTSFIVPSALLLEEMDVQPFRRPTLKQEEYVSSPLSSKE